MASDLAKYYEENQDQTRAESLAIVMPLDLLLGAC